MKVNSMPHQNQVVSQKEIVKANPYSTVYKCVLMPSRTFGYTLQEMIPDTVVSWKEFASQEFM